MKATITNKISCFRISSCMVEYCALLVAKALCLAVVQVEAIKYRRNVLAGVVFLLESLFSLMPT